MDSGNWVPVDKNVRYFFPHDRPYSVPEAYLCHSIDVNENKEFSISGYSKLWRWDRKTVRNFLDVLGQRKDSFGTGKGTGKGHQLSLKNNVLQDQKDSIGTPERTEKGQRKDTTIIIKNKKEDTGLPRSSFIPREALPYTEIVAMYHRLLPSNPKVREITDPLKKKIKARHSNGLGKEGAMEEYFKRAAGSNFLTGKSSGSKGPFLATLDWLMGPENYSKVVNGQYDNRTQGDLFSSPSGRPIRRATDGM